MTTMLLQNNYSKVQYYCEEKKQMMEWITV